MKVRKASLGIFAAAVLTMLVLCVPQARSQAAKKKSIDGQWTITVDVSDGSTETATLNFKSGSGSAITGTIETQHGTAQLSKGTVTGSTFSVEFTLTIDNGPMSVAMSGSFDGDSMKGDGSAGDATFKFTGSRAAAAH
jgi:hypothetical protein